MSVCRPSSAAYQAVLYAVDWPTWPKHPAIYVCYDIDNIMHILSQVGSPLITVHEQVGDFKFGKSCQLGYVCI